MKKYIDNIDDRPEKAAVLAKTDAFFSIDDIGGPLSSFRDFNAELKKLECVRSSISGAYDAGDGSAPAHTVVTVRWVCPILSRGEEAPIVVKFSVFNRQIAAAYAGTPERSSLHVLPNITSDASKFGR